MEVPMMAGGGVKLSLDKRVISNLPEKSPASSYETKLSDASGFELLSGSFSESLDLMTNSDRSKFPEHAIVMRIKIRGIFPNIPRFILVLIFGLDIQ